MTLPAISDSINSLISANMTNELLSLNEKLEKHNLILTKTDVKEIIKSRNETLKAQGRVELDISAIKNIIKELGESPYINQDDFVESINDMFAAFHFVKNSTSDFISDDEVIHALLFYYNELCKGSMDLLMGKGIELIIEYFRQNNKLTELSVEGDIDENETE